MPGFLPENIQTARFILLAIDPGAFDPDLNRVNNIVLADAEEVNEFQNGYRQFQSFHSGLWTIMLKETNAFVGFCGLKHFPDTDTTELGFRLIRKYWNSGFTVEAANACLSYGFMKLGLEKIAAKVPRENFGVIKLLHRLGMQQNQQLSSIEITVFYFVVSKAQWLSLQ